MEFSYEPGRFYKNDAEGKMECEILFEEMNDGQVLVITHTFVDPSLRGQGIARQLVQAVIDKAKKEGKMILPLCPYALKVFENEPDLSSLWYKQEA